MLTSKQLLEAGIKPGELFGKLLKCETLEEALKQWNERVVVQKEPSIKIIEGSAWSYLINNPCFQNMCSREFPGKIASNSEKRRWLENGSVEINNAKPKPDDIITYPVTQLVFFPSSNRITML